MGQRWSGSVEARGPPNTGKVFGVGGHCGGARLVGRSEALDGALGSWWADRTGGADRGLIREVCSGGSQCAAIQMQIYMRKKNVKSLGANIRSCIFGWFHLFKEHEDTIKYIIARSNTEVQYSNNKKVIMSETCIPYYVLWYLLFFFFITNS